MANMRTTQFGSCQSCDIASYASLEISAVLIS